MRSLTKGQRALLLPGTTGAEPWELWVLGGKASAELAQICATPLDNRLRKNTTLALPVSQVFCLPLWLNETDPKQFGGMIPLQLELRGLQPRGTEPVVFDWTIVAREGTRTLVMVGVLPATLAPEIHAEAYEAFDVSARCLPFPENALTIWREQDRLAVAITRGSNLVYYQALAEGQITPRVVQDLSCAQATLVMHDILTPLRKVTLWTEIGPVEIAALQGALPLPVEREERPQPSAPSQTWKLIPSMVGEAQRTRANRRWQKRALWIFLAVYLLAVGALVTRMVLTSRKVDELRKWKAEHAQALDAVQDGRAAWKELAPVVDTKNYPLELLREVQQWIPAEQLHLTLFKTENGHLMIQGEAKNVASAFQFYSKLKSDPYFSGYNLIMGNPRTLPNDLSQFQIEGTHATEN
ncbi:MAG TPA: PilN domain-containing protein [Candidatus Methylacidiphilales bacterium]|nr:PilN domain-containing protein [Candidatus Methylacidiphilales bacterium]